MELVYRRCSPAARRPEREVSALGFCLVNREAALGLVEARRMEQIQSSRGGPVGVGGSASRVFGARGVSPVDGSTALASPCQLRRALTAALLKSFKSIGLRLIWGWRQPFGKTADGGRQRRCPACKWSQQGPDCIFSIFQGPLCN